MRPGVAERLGVGPDACLAPQPAARLRPDDRLGPGRAVRRRRPATTSPTSPSPVPSRASAPPAGPPMPPLNLLGDFAGALYLVVGLLAALHESRQSGVGQVVDAAMVDSTAHLTTVFHGLLGRGAWRDERGQSTCSTAARRSTASTARPTAAGWRSAPWSRRSTPSCSTGSASTPPTATAVRPGDLAGAARTDRRRVRHPDPRRVDRRPSPAATRASRRCSASARRPGTRTSPPAARSSSDDGVVQPGPAPRFSRTAGAPRPPAARPPGTAPPTRSLADVARLETGERRR